MTKTRYAEAQDRDTRKRKQIAAKQETREKRAQPTTQEREDATEAEDDTDSEEMPVTQDTKRRKMDRTGIG